MSNKSKEEGVALDHIPFKAAKSVDSRLSSEVDDDNNSISSLDDTDSVESLEDGHKYADIISKLKKMKKGFDKIQPDLMSHDNEVKKLLSFAKQDIQEKYAKVRSLDSLKKNIREKDEIEKLIQDSKSLYLIFDDVEKAITSGDKKLNQKYKAIGREIDELLTRLEKDKHTIENIKEKEKEQIYSCNARLKENQDKINEMYKTDQDLKTDKLKDLFKKFDQEKEKIKKDTLEEIIALEDAHNIKFSTLLEEIDNFEEYVLRKKDDDNKACEKLINYIDKLESEIEKYIEGGGILKDEEKLVNTQYGSKKYQEKEQQTGESVQRNTQETYDTKDDSEDDNLGEEKIDNPAENTKKSLPMNNNDIRNEPFYINFSDIENKNEDAFLGYGSGLSRFFNMAFFVPLNVGKNYKLDIAKRCSGLEGLINATHSNIEGMDTFGTENNPFVSVATELYGNMYAATLQCDSLNKENGCYTQLALNIKNAIENDQKKLLLLNDYYSGGNKITESEALKLQKEIHESLRSLSRDLVKEGQKVHDVIATRTRQRTILYTVFSLLIAAVAIIASAVTLILGFQNKLEALNEASQNSTNNPLDGIKDPDISKEGFDEIDKQSDAIMDALTKTGNPVDNDPNGYIDTFKNDSHQRMYYNTAPEGADPVWTPINEIHDPRILLEAQNDMNNGNFSSFKDNYGNSTPEVLDYLKDPNGIYTGDFKTIKAGGSFYDDPNRNVVMVDNGNGSIVRLDSLPQLDQMKYEAQIENGDFTGVYGTDGKTPLNANNLAGYEEFMGNIETNNTSFSNDISNKLDAYNELLAKYDMQIDVPTLENLLKTDPDAFKVQMADIDNTINRIANYNPDVDGNFASYVDSVDNNNSLNTSPLIGSYLDDYNNALAEYNIDLDVTSLKNLLNSDPAAFKIQMEDINNIIDRIGNYNPNEHGDFVSFMESINKNPNLDIQPAIDKYIAENPSQFTPNPITVAEAEKNLAIANWAVPTGAVATGIISSAGIGIVSSALSNKAKEEYNKSVIESARNVNMQINSINDRNKAFLNQMVVKKEEENDKLKIAEEKKKIKMKETDNKSLIYSNSYRKHDNAKSLYDLLNKENPNKGGDNYRNQEHARKVVRFNDDENNVNNSRFS